MKKFFYLVAIVATVALTACGGGKTEQKLSADDQSASGQHECVNNSEKISVDDKVALNALVSYIDNKLLDDAENDGEVTYKGTKLEGRDIVMTAIVDESKLPDGFTVKSALQMSGRNTDAMADQLAKEMFKDAPAEAKPWLDVIHRCNSDIVYRMEGSRSHEYIELRIPSEKLPK